MGRECSVFLRYDRDGGRPCQQPDSLRSRAPTTSTGGTCPHRTGRLQGRHPYKTECAPTTTPVVPSTATTVPQVERPAVNRIEAAVPLRCKGKLELTVAEPSGPKVLQPFQKPVRFYDVYLDGLIYGRQGDWDERVRHVVR